MVNITLLLIMSGRFSIIQDACDNAEECTRREKSFAQRRQLFAVAGGVRRADAERKDRGRGCPLCFESALVLLSPCLAVPLCFCFTILTKAVTYT